MKPVARLQLPLPGSQPLRQRDDPTQTGSRAALLWRLMGMGCVAIGIVNAFIPLLPTTVFLLIGVWAYGKGDPALRRRLLEHPRYGRALTLWVEHRQITRRGKLAACGGIALSAAITLVWIGPHKAAGWMVAGGLALLCLYLLTRNEP